MAAFYRSQSLTQGTRVDIFAALRRAVQLADATPLSTFLYRRIPDQNLSATARNQVWTLTHKTTALDALGDTAGSPGLADSIQRFGRSSGLGPDRLLHRYLRGLLARAAAMRKPRPPFTGRSCRPAMKPVP